MLLDVRTRAEFKEEVQVHLAHSFQWDILMCMILEVLEIKMKNHLIITVITVFLSVLQFSVRASDYRKIQISDDIELFQLSEKAYVHVSISEIAGFGKVSSNGLIFVNGDEAFLFDTPVTNSQTETLVKWIADSLSATVSTFIPNHWHIDNLGGLEYLHSIGIKSYANQMTIDLAKENGMPVPCYEFTDSLSLYLRGDIVECHFFGGGHSADNIVVWIPSEKILFPGCMIKDIHSKGLVNLADATLDEWYPTIQKMITKFPDAKIVIPGHGQIGGKELLEHTSKLLKE